MRERSEVGYQSKEVREPAVKAVEPVHAEGFPVTISETEAALAIWGG